MAHEGPVRFAVVGLGHIAQAAVLPAFANAEYCQLAALVTDDFEKVPPIKEQYDVDQAVHYDDYDRLMASGDVDAVYIALPNSLHCEYAERAAAHGVSVLCEKPMAITEDECKRMITAAERTGAKLMLAYRLHFDEANLHAIELARSGRLGDVRVFNSTFSINVAPGNVRVQPELGGGTLYDIGIYCINAARYLFRDEPLEVVAASFNTGDPRFEGVDETTSAVLRFPGDRVAAFTSTFGGEGVDEYRLIGTQGSLRMEPAYTYIGDRHHFVSVDRETTQRTFPPRDQFAPLLVELARAIREDRPPHPGGLEGLADVRIIEAIYRSAIERRPIQIPATCPPQRPELSQAMRRPPVDEPELIGVESPEGD
ncbi:MAG TPA: Gfo/Idh/MocA family oxidoreductase [Lacipirellulaceae bacterium]|nr:Gfo/Idh/MocA family oxidoreductase [Lacipirellulaceae bacterium]